MKALAPLLSAFRAWERFLFEPVDARVLGFLRAVFGAYLFIYYLDGYSFLNLHHFPPGLLPPGELRALGPNLLSYVAYGSVGRWAVYGMMLVASLWLSIGLQTRLAATLCFLLNQALMGSLPSGRNSGDAVVTIACFLMLVAALAGHAQAAYSLDARLATRPKDEASVPAWPLRLFQIQLVYIYFFSGFHKLGSHDWYTGQAVYYVLQQRGFARLDLSAFTHPVFIGLATYGTLFFELLVFPVLVWVRALRPFVLAMGLLFHVGVALSMRVFVFGEIMPLLYLSFVNAVPVLEALAKRVRVAIGRVPHAQPAVLIEQRPDDLE